MKFSAPAVKFGRLASSIAAALVLSACANQPAADGNSAAANATATSSGAPNIIFMIGDGMGFEYISAYRYAMSELGAGELAATPFDDLLTGAATTYPDDDTWVTDSAASATALATGVKSYNGAIGIDAKKNPQQTLMEKAREHGWGTGAVATVQVNHATPASFFTHHPSRNQYNEIADSYASQVTNGGWSFDVLLGGGYQYFHRDDKNWLPQLQQQGLSILTDATELDQQQQLPVLGLFADKALPFAIDDKPGRLAHMTSQALRLLTEQSQQTNKPFALMVEGSMIDWCGHANDIACAVHEMADFAAAVQVVREYLAQHPNTLLVITADHSTGGLTLGQGGEYAWHSEQVMGITASLEQMTKQLLQLPREQWRDYLAPILNLPVTEQQWQQLEQVQIDDSLRGRDRQYPLGKVLVQIISEHTRTGWTTTGHTAVDVPVMATGPGAEAFRGYLDNTELAQALLQLVR
ncbi:alkaline phosphatase [Pseudidiomarina sp. PP-1MA]|uniref:Alkaline phosphatase n=1 Tax=Pseudidiomarina sp. PP-1MA TaxID=3237706 RepID=A0AB39X654_9GAMM